jgi:putative transposase
MARQWRIEYEGALYHVLSLGNERSSIFSDDNDRKTFLETLGQMSHRFDVEIHAYVLMDNHYHLLLKTNRPNLSKSMQWFGTTYTRRYNSAHGRSGHLFQGRFKNHIVEDETYLMRLSCYIHRNPLRAGMVHRLVDYPWSSYKTYAYGKKAPWWLKTDMILSLFKGRDKHKVYREHVQGYAKEEGRILEDIRHGLFIGSRTFIERIKKEFLSDDRDHELPQRLALQKDRDVIGILREGARYLECDMDKIRESLRIDSLEKEKRDMLLYLLWESGQYSGKEIGELFGIGYSSVSRRGGIVRDRLEQDRVFKKKYEGLKSIIQI